ncbi:hypothetical protein Zmor_002535 [Zophobas morio]|uniref:Uncharacterized protein n=1 Tax=Zophobas morio TaxID=2755281 RepID=A0AA38J6L1_9CUCU|nr:hypothetical protein Zmor_002535 [Zophobas morio]
MIPLHVRLGYSVLVFIWLNLMLVFSKNHPFLPLPLYHNLPTSSGPVQVSPQRIVPHLTTTAKLLTFYHLTQNQEMPLPRAALPMPDLDVQPPLTALLLERELEDVVEEGLGGVGLDGGPL